MKKTKIFIGTLAATALLTSIASCKKDKTTTTTPIISSSTLQDDYTSNLSPTIDNTSSYLPSTNTDGILPSTSPVISNTTPSDSITGDNNNDDNNQNPDNSDDGDNGSNTTPEINKYSVTYYINGHGTQPDNLTEQTNLPDKLPVLTETNFEFIGWYKDSEFKEIAVAGEALTSNVVLYAKWQYKTTQSQDNSIKFNFTEFKALCEGKTQTTTKDGKDTVKTTEDITYSQFKFPAGVKINDSLFNTQGRNIYFTVNGISNSFTINGTNGSSDKALQYELYLCDSNGNPTGSAIVTSQSVSKGGTLTFTKDGLAAGTYILKNLNGASDKVSKLELIEKSAEAAKQAYNVTFESNNGTKIPQQTIEEGSISTKPIDPTKDGYIFKGWFTDSNCTIEFNFTTPITDNITLYAKWEEEPKDPNATYYKVEFETNGGSIIDSYEIIENSKIKLPTNPTKEGYSLAGWFTDEACTKEYNWEAKVTSNVKLYAKWIPAQYTVSFVGTTLASQTITHNGYITRPANPEKSGYTFVGWFTTNTYTTEFDFENTKITSNTSIFAKFNKNVSSSDSNIDDKENGSGSVGTQGTITILEAGASIESAYIEFKKYNNSVNYDYYITNSSGQLEKVGTDIAYGYETSSTTMRVEFLGLKAGTYEAMVLPSGSSTDIGSHATFNVISYDRSGYAHFNYTSGVGAYNDDGTLKDNAIVLYVTDDNKNTVQLSYKGKTVKGIGNILNSVGKECGEAGHEGQCKKVSKGKTYYGTANTNAGILQDLANDNIPLVVRFIGTVSNSGLYKQGTFNANSKTLVEGLTAYDSNDYGGSEGDNGHMARMKSAKDVTLEGLGTDAVIDGWGFHFMCESANPDLGKSFEVRNLTFINTPEDAIGMEGVQESGMITASVERCWVHNNEFYCPSISSPAESDKSEGDGSCDFKRGEYFTLSYNYFEGCHKTNLIGSSDSSLQYNITMHHNYWKLCEARGPLVRNANVHMYNNVFEQQTSYAMNPRANAYIYSEYNMFYMCKNAQDVTSGAIKSYNDSFSSCIGALGGTIVTDKSQTVSNNCKYAGKNIDYSKFDTNSSQSYIPNNNYDLQTNVTDARKVIYAYGGVRKDSNVAPGDVTLDDLNIIVSKDSVNEINAYPSTVTPGKIQKTSYAFKITKSATVSVKYDSDASGSTGVLLNQAGECLLSASGSVVLNPGTYYVQPDNFQPGKGGMTSNLQNGSLKSVTITSIKFEEYDSDELNQKLIDQYNTAVSQIPTTIEYNSTCLTTIKKAMSTYNNLSAELKQQVDYTKVQTAYNTYISLGKSHVEGLINNIGTVDANSGNAITTARNAYNELVSFAGNITISNYSTLTSAESAFAQYAVQYVIDKINSIGEVTLDKESIISSARNAYDSLEKDEQALVTNYQTLVQAEKKFTNLEKSTQFDELINDVDLTNISSMREVVNAYNNLTSDQIALITTSSKVSEVKVALTIKLIDAIGKVTSTSGSAINEAEEMYNSLTTSEKSLVTNYDTLKNAKDAYQDVAPSVYTLTFSNSAPAGDTDFFTVSGSYKDKIALKMQTKEGSIKFTTTGACTVTIYDRSGKKSIKINGIEYSFTNKVVTVTLDKAGTYEITKGDGEAQITKVEVSMN